MAREQARATVPVGDVLCWNIIVAVSEVIECDGLAIDEQLGTVFDVESLERLAISADASDKITIKVSFEYAGCEVTVRGINDIDVREITTN